MDTVNETAPGPLPRPPAEPIVIRTPPRPRDDPELETPGDAGGDEPEAEIRRPPPWIPDRPPPPPPLEERAARR